MSEARQAALITMVRPIREAMELWDLEPEHRRPPPVSVLAQSADKVCQQVRAAHLRNASRQLPLLISDLTYSVQTAPSTEVWRTLASVYRTAHDVALKLGYPDLATVALDRMGWAADHASDPCLAAIRQYKRALGRKTADHELGARLIAAGHDLISGETSREALAVAGQLHLGAVSVAAREDNPSAVKAHITAARELATRVGGEAPDIHWLSFGHTNVALHEMGASLTMRSFDVALTQARAVKLSPSVVTSRRARYLVDRAVVEMEVGSTAAALRHLVAARKAAPEQTRYHPGTHEVVTGLLHAVRSTPDTLSHMATWIGL
jgi:hypothetical protein